MYPVIYIITLQVALLSMPLLHGQEVVTIAGNLSQAGYKDGDGQSARFNNPHGIARDQNGNLYIADRYNHLIRKISPEGEVTTLAGREGIAGDDDGPGGIATFNEPWDLCVAPSGIVYVADTRNHMIRQISPSGEVTTLAGNGNYGHRDAEASLAQFGLPTGIEVAENGDLYVADHATHVIRRVTPAGTVTTIAGKPLVAGDQDGQGFEAYFNRPYGLTISAAGNILVADEWNHKIRELSPTGVVTTLAGKGTAGYQDGTAAVAQFNYPWDVVEAPDGTLYVGDGYNYLIRGISPEGEVFTLTGIPENSGGVDGSYEVASFNGATSLSIDPISGSIYLTDAYNHLIRRIDFEDSASTYEDLKPSNSENTHFLPTAFSPNGDGRNDVFRIRGLTSEQVIDFRIYDHWGQQLFRASDGLSAWDGRVRQQTATPGTYTYTLQYRNTNGKLQQQAGFFTLHY